MFGHKLASRTMNTISLFGAVRDVRPQAGISNDEHDYTIKEFQDFINYDLMIKWCAMILFDAVRDVRPQAGISNDEYDYTIKRFHDFF